MKALALPSVLAALVAALVLVAPAPAAADEGSVSHPNNVYVARDNFTAFVAVPACQDVWVQLPEIAARLGVGPVDRAKGPTLVLTMCDGRSYDLNELVVKLLDRLDGVTK